jgi:DNA polymerase-4
MKTIKTFLLHMSEKLGSRLRQHNLQAKKYFVGLRLGPGFWLGDKLRLSHASNDGKAIYKLCLHVLETKWNNDAIVQVQITALDPRPERQQLELFEQHDEVAIQVNQVMDKVNHLYGEFALAPARLVNRSSMPNVIAPAWKPTGHRQSIPPPAKK